MDQCNVEDLQLFSNDELSSIMAAFNGGADSMVDLTKVAGLDPQILSMVGSMTPK